ncbi:MAG: P-loop NTPase [Eubacteriales bacterium]|nr:P-loop NTPase [Eubacteriales bacterium]
MSETCNQSCSSCGEDCADRKIDFSEKLHVMSDVKKVIGVVSGKGGVGKSLITSLLAVTMQRRGCQTAILDADITGPSIPKVFGLKEKAQGTDAGIFPVKSKTGIDIMSINLLLENDSDPVIFRGPIIAGTVKQFWSNVIWSGEDYMFVDMPPGTGDVALTVFQSIAVDGIIIVASPQELVSMIVTKAVKMANMMNIPIIGLVENMSYFKCPDNGKDYKIFGESHIDEIAAEYGLEVLARLPIDPKFSGMCDRGMIELFEGDWLEAAADKIELITNKKEIKKEEKMIKIAVASEQDMVTEHFGHCVNFNIYETENGKITKSESIENPGHRPGFLPNFLNDLGVNVIIAGGMGGGAIEIFDEKGIEVITGATGEAKAAAEAYLLGSLKSTGSVCHDHQHAHGEGCGGGCGH